MHLIQNGLTSHETATLCLPSLPTLANSGERWGWSHHFEIRHTKRPRRTIILYECGVLMHEAVDKAAVVHSAPRIKQCCTLNQANSFPVTEKEKYEYHQMHSPLHLLSQHVEIITPASVKAPTALPESCTRSILAACLAACCPSHWRRESPELSHIVRCQTATLGMQRYIVW